VTRLRGAQVLVTGASSGIGQAVALSFARAGARLMLTGRDEHRLARVADRTGADALVADLADPAGLSQLLDAATTPPLPQVVVHCAGIGHVAAAGEQDDAVLERLLAVNLRAPVLLTGAVLPGMRAAGAGHLVFVTSIAGRLGVAGESAYAASKGALDAYAASLAAEIGGTGVGVTTVVPGVVDTAFFRSRNVGYGRRFPRPVPAARVAAALRRAVQQDRAEVVVPAWLRLPIAVRALAPGTYARSAGRWG
jgi:short-subunit dehydrogenase